MRCALRALFVAWARATREASGRAVEGFAADAVVADFVCACGFGAGFVAVELALVVAFGAVSVIVATAVCVPASADAPPDALASGERTSVACLLVVCGRRAAL